MKLLGHIFYALGTAFFLFYVGFIIVNPGYYALWEVVEPALFLALFAVWLWDGFSPLSARLKFTLGAVAFTWAALAPEYNLFTAIFGALALAEIVAAYLAWREYRAENEERELLDRLINAYEDNPTEFAGLNVQALRERRDDIGNHK